MRGLSPHEHPESRANIRKTSRAEVSEVLSTALDCERFLAREELLNRLYDQIGALSPRRDDNGFVPKTERERLIDRVLKIIGRHKP